MSEKNRAGFLAQVSVAVVIALAAGGSAPWWWDRMFPSSDHESNNNSNNEKSITESGSFTQQKSNFSEGSKRVYFANFKQWPTKSSEHGSISLTSTNSYVIQPSGNTWVGPGRLIETPSIEGDFVFDIWFEFQNKFPASLHFQITGGGIETSSVGLYLTVWNKDKVTYSLTKDLVRSGNGLPIPYVVRSEKISSRERLSNDFKDHNWSKGSKLTLKREGGRLQLFVNDGFVKQFPASLFPVQKIGIGAAFASRVVVTSIEARVKKKI